MQVKIDDLHLMSAERYGVIRSLCARVWNQCVLCNTAMLDESVAMVTSAQCTGIDVLDVVSC